MTSVIRSVLENRAFTVKQLQESDEVKTPREKPLV